ncbi:hypothetical protein [Xanthomonas medicagonis]|uniref:hypothetical protein n=1 Tax=Xanthomonas medicagonis TaxID=3160841 RepID=UPI003514A3C3
MALDFYLFSKKTARTESFKIDGVDLHLFEKSFLDLQKSTGVFIDPYGRCKIHPEHLRIIVSSLDGVRGDKVCRFIDFLKEAIDQHELLIADGD